MWRPGRPSCGPRPEGRLRRPSAEAAGAAYNRASRSDRSFDAGRSPSFFDPGGIRPQIAMASQLDLEEQEQLDQLKHFWKRYGNAITWLLIVVLGAFAAYNGWQYWQRKQAAEAAVMYEQIESAAKAGDLTRLERALADMQERYAGATYAHQAALLAARVFYDKDKADRAKAALAWVADKAGDEGLQAVARLRLAGIALEAKAYDEALAQLGAKLPAEFAALADDRRGDVFLAQGKKAEAQAEYRKAYKGMDERAEYRRLVEVKLNALGVDVSEPAAAEVKK